MYKRQASPPPKAAAAPPPSSKPEQKEDENVVVEVLKDKAPATSSAVEVIKDKAGDGAAAAGGAAAPGDAPPGDDEELDDDEPILEAPDQEADEINALANSMFKTNVETAEQSSITGLGAGADSETIKITQGALRATMRRTIPGRAAMAGGAVNTARWTRSGGARAENGPAAPVAGAVDERNSESDAMAQTAAA